MAKMYRETIERTEAQLANLKYNHEERIKQNEDHISHLEARLAQYAADNDKQALIVQHLEAEKERLVNKLKALHKKCVEKVKRSKEKNARKLAELHAELSLNNERYRELSRDVHNNEMSSHSAIEKLSRDLSCQLDANELLRTELHQKELLLSQTESKWSAEFDQLLRDSQKLRNELEEERASTIMLKIEVEQWKVRADTLSIELRNIKLLESRQAQELTRNSRTI